jgi:DNA polymerase-4
VNKKIIHIDMDSFYASVELRDRPELRGKPIAVGGSPEGRGVVATASYEARKFGVRSAMSSRNALRLCPELILIYPNFSKYKKASKHVREIFERFTTLVEPLSLDEAYLDVTEAANAAGSATAIAKEIRRLIELETGLTASAGVAPNKFLAKIASEWNKPNGLKVIRPEEIADIMLTLPIEKIWGVGKVTAAKMREMGLLTCGDLQKLSVSELNQRFGSWGVKLYDYARGIDEREVSTDRDRKSLSIENTYRNDLPNLQACLQEIGELFDDWQERFRRSGDETKIRTAFVKLKFHDFRTTTHEAPQAGEPGIQVFQKLLKEAFERDPNPVRLIGVGVRLEGSREKPRKTPQLQFPME